MGPTATGKTQLAIRLSKYYPIEIISVDSALIYKDMNIGTAKPSFDELNSVPHHLIDIIFPTDSYSVANFINDSLQLIDEINQRGKIPVLVGGTMMYFNGLLNGISNLPEANPSIRNELFIKGTTIGFDKLHQELLAIDAIAGAKIMPNDRQRIIRALEVFYLTGVPISKLQQENKVKNREDINYIPLAILPSQRDILHTRINQRFEQMLMTGFVEEVKELKHKYPTLTLEHSSMRSVGYYQVWEYLSGNLNYQQMVEAGMAATRQLAKRQITWLRSMDIINIAKSELELNQLFNNLLDKLKLLVK